LIKQHRILVATTNPGKLAEIRSMLDLPVELVGLKNFPDIGEIAEDGQTFAENARKKAIGYSVATGLWTIADDSGLVIDVLRGDPGVKSARFAGVNGDRKLVDKKNIEKVLRLLKDVPEEKRTARFVCCLCLADGGKILAETKGTVEGVIIDKPRGENGFGYDPIFFVPKLNKTVAQLASEEKNLISHRGNAIRKLKPLLEKLLRQS
jgi:XTP/dITP diphosphohydrolase